MLGLNIRPPLGTLMPEETNVDLPASFDARE
jgi:hypothetical protein